MIDMEPNPKPTYLSQREAQYEKARASVAWLKENYSHIWFHPDIGYRQKAGFLAACCDSRRCFLATLSLHERVTHIEHALIQMGIP